MVYNMDKPTKNMLMSQSELAKMIYESNELIYKEEENNNLLQESARAREKEEAVKAVNEYAKSKTLATANRLEFLTNVKEAMVTECIYKLYKDCSILPMNENGKKIVKSLCSKLVKEHGAGDLMAEFATKNLVLSEFARICYKYYGAVVESCNKEGVALDYTLDKDIANDFYDELDKVDTEDVSKIIKDRVADAITEFVDSNMAAKLEYEDIIKQAQDKIDATKDTDIKEEASILAQRNITEARLKKSRNVYSMMVEALTKSILTNEELRTKYVTESSVDMEKITNAAQLVYTMLEMLNTTNMVNVDTEYVQNYIDTLSM